MCGKDAEKRISAFIFQGSPPHVRERLRGRPVRRQFDGITPACAGKTWWIDGPVLVEEDHPRMCGKDGTEWEFKAVGVGSPPHVRERLLLCKNILKWLGITPACAGKTT